MNRFVGRATLLAVLLAMSGPAFAQEEEDERIIVLREVVADTASLFDFDWGIPTSPALTLAGLSPEKTPTSSSLKDFVLAIPTITGGDEQGQALALDFAPVALLSNQAGVRTFEDYTSDDYQWDRLARRTRIGAAIFEGNDGGADPAKQIASRLAIGLSVSLLDDSDPLMQTVQRGERRGENLLVSCLNAESPRVNRILDASIADVTASEDFDSDFDMLTTEERAELRRLPTLRDALNVQMTALGVEIDAVTARQDISAAVRDSELARLRAEIDAVEKEQERLNDLGDKMRQVQFERSDEGSASIVRAVERCSQRASLQAEISRDLDIGIGALWRGEPGAFSDFDEAGAAAWIAFRQPVSALFGDDSEGNPEVRSYWMFAASGRASTDEFLATGDDSTPEIRADVVEGWVGAERFSPDLRLAVHYGYREVSANEPAGAPFEQSGERYLVSAQIRIGEQESGMWLGVSYGDANGSVDSLDDETALVTLRYSPPPRYNIGR